MTAPVATSTDPRRRDTSYKGCSHRAALFLNRFFESKGKAGMFFVRIRVDFLPFLGIRLARIFDLITTIILGMIRTSSFLITSLSLAALFLSGCEVEVEPNPAPPAGSYVFGDEGNETGGAVVELPDGNLLLVGGVQDPATNDWDILLIKSDVNGNEITRNVVGQPDYNEVIRSAKPSIYGGYLLAGHAKSNENDQYRGLVMVIDENLQVQQSHDFLVVTYNDPNFYDGYYNQQSAYAEAFDMPDQGWIYTSFQVNYTNVIRLSPSGALQSNLYSQDQAYTYSSNYPARNYFQDIDLSVYKCEIPYDYSVPQAQFKLTKYRFDGLTDFSSQYLLDSGNVNYGSNNFGGITRLQNGNMLFTYNVTNGSQYMVEAELNGNIVWTRSINTSAAYYLVRQGEDNKIYVAGSPNDFAYNPNTDKNITIASFDSTGGSFRRKTFGGPAQDYPSGIAYLSNGKTAVFGTTFSYGAGGADMYLTFN
jgi:hypothetical protein